MSSNKIIYLIIKPQSNTILYINWPVHQCYKLKMTIDINLLTIGTIKTMHKIYTINNNCNLKLDLSYTIFQNQVFTF